MSGFVNGVFVIAPEPPQQCDDCGVIAQLRPYGPGGSCICWECGQKTPRATAARAVLAMTGWQLDETQMESLMRHLESTDEIGTTWQ